MEEFVVAQHDIQLVWGIKFPILVATRYDAVLRSQMYNDTILTARGLDSEVCNNCQKVRVQ